MTFKKLFLTGFFIFAWVVVIILKIAGLSALASFSWWWILIPIWIPIAGLIVLIAGVLIYLFAALLIGIFRYTFNS